MIVWNGYRHYEAQVVMLASLKDLIKLQGEQHPQIRESIITENLNRLVEAESRASNQDDMIRHTTSEGQAACVSTFQGYLIITGACMFVIGKALVLLATQKRYKGP